jgi:hypothetical protein
LKYGELSADNVYHVDEIGWTTTIPDGWEIVTQQEMGKLKRKVLMPLKKHLKQKLIIQMYKTYSV